MLKDFYARAITMSNFFCRSVGRVIIDRTAFLQRCAVWSLPRIGVPARSVDYRVAGEYFGKSTRLDIVTEYLQNAGSRFELQDRETYGEGWPESDWVHVVAEYKVKGEWTTSDERDHYIVTRPAVSPRRVLGLFAAHDLGNRLRSRFGAWMMGRCV